MSATGLGSSPFETRGDFTASNANAMNNAINDNDDRLDTVEALAGNVVSNGDGTFVGGAHVAGNNLIPDPDFFLAGGGNNCFWQSTTASTDYGTGVYGLYGENNRSGLYLAHASKKYDHVYTDIKIPVKYGESYQWSIRYFLSSDYTDDGNTGITLQMLVRDRDGTYLSEDAGGTTGVGTLNSWATASGTVTITSSDAQYANLAIFIYDSGAAGTGSAKIDNVSFELSPKFEKDTTAAGAGTDGTISSRSANALGECDGFVKMRLPDGTTVYVPYWEDITPS